MRLLRPSLAVFCVALLASLCIHLPVYEVLGALANVLLRESPAEKHGPIELELAPLAPADAPTATPTPAPSKADSRATPPEVKQKPPRPIAAAEQRKPEPIKKKPLPIEPEIVEAVPTPHSQQTDRPLAVKQKTDKPDETPPDNARFIAEESRRVQEETVARVRNMHRDDENPTATAGPTNTNDDLGNAEKTDVADLHDVRGSDERPPDRREAEHPPSQPSRNSAGRRDAEAVPRAASEAASAPSPAVSASRASGAPETGGEPQTIVVQDGVGSFRIRKAPPGQGPGSAGAALRPGRASSERDDRAGSRAQVGSNVNLRLSWSQFEQTFGADELRTQREAYLAQRRSTSEGQSRKRKWEQFRAAIENFVPNVRPGDQTALNAAADPFADYLSEVHRRIHRKFAEDFLQTLPLIGGIYGDYSLHTVLEIVINGDGTVHKIGVTETSGLLPFDQNAFNAVMAAAPYPEPPRKILSGDGRVYVHWGFYRNERQCGTFNAQPYILPHPPGTPKPGNSPLHDPGDQQQGAPANRPGEGELGFHGLRRSFVVSHASR